MGESGSGSYTKLANNRIGAINLLSFSEAITMAVKSGIDPEMFIKVVSGGGARNGMMDNKGPKVINRDFPPHFMTDLIYKDLCIASDVAKELEVPTQFLSLVRERFKMARGKGFGSAVIKCYEELAGVGVKKVK